MDYAGLIERQDELDAYLRTVADASFDALGRDEKLALLINAYNAATLRLMTEHPGIDSIRSIPAAERWDDVRWNVGGAVYSLTQIENGAIRPNFIEPRVHWALVCAAVGCPPLRNEAYTAETLEAQLDSQSRTVFTRGTRWYAVSPDEQTLKLSAIMKWYRGDFEQTAGGLPQHVTAYDVSVERQVAAGEPPAVDFLDYDWNLNNQANIGAATSGGGAEPSAEE